MAKCKSRTWAGWPQKVNSIKRNIIELVNKRNARQALTFFGDFAKLRKGTEKVDLVDSTWCRLYYFVLTQRCRLCLACKRMRPDGVENEFEQSG